MGKVVVLGSINQDVVAVSDRHPLPGETVHGSKLLQLPGGKGANEAVAVACADVESILIGAVGDDMAGQQLLSFLNDRGVNTKFVKTETNITSGTAIITVNAEGENTIVVIPAANERVTDDSSVELDDTDVLLSVFEVPLESIQAFFERGRAAGSRTILNPSPAQTIPTQLLDITDILIVNETELAMLAETAVDPSNHDEIVKAAKKLFANGTVVVTLGALGAVAVDSKGLIEIAGKPVGAIDTTGAGDCFVGSLAAELANGATLDTAMQYANQAAAICVTRRGAGPSMPLRSEVNK